MGAASASSLPQDAVTGAGVPKYAVGDFYDEAFESSGSVRPHYEGALRTLGQMDLTVLAERVTEEIERMGVAFGSPPDAERFHVDPVPRIMAAAEWGLVERALSQRVRALRAFTADVYGPRRIVADGVVPERAVETCAYFEPWMLGVEVPEWSYMPVAGMDLVRGSDGRLAVLEDNVRTPSGLTYAAAARTAADRHLPAAPPERRSLAPAFDRLGAALRASAPDGHGDPHVILLSDGPANSAWYEHRALARSLDIPLVTPDDLYPSRGRLRVLVDRRSREVDVVYRRTDEDRLMDEHGRPTWVADVLLDPCRTGRLTCVNAFGGGVADDKLIHAYVDAMVRFYLDEQPLIRSVPTYDLGVPAVRESILERIDEVVVKPRAGHGGYGILVGPHARREDLERAAGQIKAEPGEWVAQETVSLSTHPTVDAGTLAPRHVDLRAFVMSDDVQVEVAAGGLTRFGRDAGALVVNSSQNGGGKDTWVMS
jgi:uncharacterized circularly permuted ATP-grasp superfamily protein